MSTATVADIAWFVRVTAQTAVANETYFSDLDAVVGDGDFGHSLARGFETVLAHWAEVNRTDIGAILGAVATTLTSRVGGTSGPIWGTAFLRAASAARGSATLDGAQLVGALRAAVDGIVARGGAALGDKTLLDALVPAIDAAAQALDADLPPAEVLQAAAAAAREGADATRALQARRGRAAYTGERSIGSVDAGAAAVAVLLQALAEQYLERIA